MNHAICYQTVASTLLIALAVVPFVAPSSFSKNSKSKTGSKRLNISVQPLEVSTVTQSQNEAVGRIFKNFQNFEGKPGQEDEPEEVECIEKYRGIEALKIAFDPKYLDSASEDDLPYNWVEGANFNRKIALSKWKNSLKWRKETNADTILTKPPPGFTQEKFNKIKEIWPQCFPVINEDGYLITIEKYRGLDKICVQMKRNGITPEDFTNYAVFLTEYWIWKYNVKRGKMLKFIDVAGLTIGFNLRIIVKYFGTMNVAVQQYPEILHQAYFLNVDKAGTPFRILFKMLPSFLDKRTLSKLHTLKLSNPDSTEKLKSLCDPEFLPTIYGGNYEGEFCDLPIEKDIKNFVSTFLPKN